MNRRRPLSQRFPDPDLEAAFRAERTRSTLPIVRGGLAAGVVLSPAIGLLGTLVAQADVAIVAVLVVTGVTLDIALLAILRGDPTPRMVDRAGVVSNVVHGLVIIGLALAAPTIAVYAVPGLIFTAIYTFVVFQLPLGPGLATAAVYLAAFVLLPVHGQSLATTALDLVIIVGAVALGGQASYQLERSARERFLQRRTIEAQAAEIAAERAKSDRLLRNVLPAQIAARLRDDPGAIAEGYDAASVLFADIVGFTPLSERLGPQRTAALLNELVSRFDELAAGFGLEKIKTIGDAYLVVGGIPEPRPDHACRVARLGLAMIASALAHPEAAGSPIRLRIGIHSGPVVAGVIGRTKFAYDVWGDTVNVASRLQSAGVPGEVQASQSTVALLDGSFSIVSRGELELKGKGAMPVFFVRAGAPSSRASEDPADSAEAMSA